MEAFDPAVAGRSDTGIDLGKRAEARIPMNKGRSRQVVNPGVENPLELAQALFEAARAPSAKQAVDGQKLPRTSLGFSVLCLFPAFCLRRSFHRRYPRSEEHTSELQSLIS